MDLATQNNHCIHDPVLNRFYVYVHVQHCHIFLRVHHAYNIPIIELLDDPKEAER